MTEAPIGAPLQPGDPGFLDSGTKVGAHASEQDDVQADYFGFGDTTKSKYTFPDGKTFIEVKKLNAGDRKQYEQMTRGDVTLDRRSGDAKLHMNPGRDRDALLMLSICGWNLMRAGRPTVCNRTQVEDWLELSDIEFIDKVYEQARKVNKWLESEMTIEDIDSEIERLNEQREELKERDRGEAFSSSK